MNRKAYWAKSLGGKLRCPQCGGVVVEHGWGDEDEMRYECTNEWECDWGKVVDMTKEIVEEEDKVNSGLPFEPEEEKDESSSN